MGDWRERAACANQAALFFAPDSEREPHRSERIRAAKGVCTSCPVMGECLEYALDSGQEHGVWGGLDEDELRRLRGRYVRARRRSTYATNGSN